jgi:hypothetical protein
MPQTAYLDTSVTAEELEYHGIPNLYYKHCIMGRVLEPFDVLSLPYLVRNQWGYYEDDEEGRWYHNMHVWVEYDQWDDEDEWGTLNVRFHDPRQDPVKLFEALKSVPEGGTLSPTWYDERWDVPSARFDRAAFWTTPNTIWRWTGLDFGLERLFFDVTDPDNLYEANRNDERYWAWNVDATEAMWDKCEEPNELEEDQGIEEWDEEALIVVTPPPLWEAERKY